MSYISQNSELIIHISLSENMFLTLCMIDQNAEMCLMYFVKKKGLAELIRIILLVLNLGNSKTIFIKL